MSQWNKKTSVDIPYDFLGSPIHFDINGKSLERLIAVIALRESGYKGWSFNPNDNRIVLWKYFDTKEKAAGVNAFLTEMEPVAVAHQVWSWLQSEAVKWPEEPDHDGSNSKGWRAYVDDIFGHCFLKLPDPEKERWASADWGAALVIEPMWLEYHK